MASQLCILFEGIVRWFSGLQVWRLLAQLVHEPDRGTVGSGGAARRLIGSDGSSHGGSSLATFNSLAIDLINLTSAGPPPIMPHYSPPQSPAVLCMTSSTLIEPLRWAKLLLSWVLQKVDACAW